MKPLAVFPSLVATVLLHGGGTVGTTGDVHWSYVVASIAFVGVVVGSLYWYYGTRLRDEERAETR